MEPKFSFHVIGDDFLDITLSLSYGVSFNCWEQCTEHKCSTPRLNLIVYLIFVTGNDRQTMILEKWQYARSIQLAPVTQYGRHSTTVHPPHVPYCIVYAIIRQKVAGNPVSVSTFSYHLLSNIRFVQPSYPAPWRQVKLPDPYSSKKIKIQYHSYKFNYYHNINESWFISYV